MAGDPDASDEGLNSGAEQTEYDDLMGKSVEDILREGQKVLFARLVGKCRSGNANHQELAILRNILKDNGMTLGIPPEQPADGDSPAPLPLSDPDDEVVPEFQEPGYLQ